VEISAFQFQREDDVQYGCVSTALRVRILEGVADEGSTIDSNGEIRICNGSPGQDHVAGDLLSN